MPLQPLTQKLTPNKLLLITIYYFRISILEKDTMSTKFTEYKGLDLPTVASEVLNFWKKETIFEKSISTREGNTLFVFFEGPPSANGLPGIHHVMARAIKDIFCRYKTQKGFQVKRKAGWDTHG